MPKQKWRWAVFLQAGCTKELSPEIYVSVKEGGTSDSLLAPSLSADLSLSLSLSNKTRIYWNAVVFAFQTQYIRELFVKKILIWACACNMYIVFHFCTGILRLSSDFSTLSA